MLDNMLFYFIFFSQIILISYYFPRKMLSRINYIFETYPPSKYPKLYPEPFEYYKKAQSKYKLLNLIILVTGLLLLAVLIGFSPNGELDQNIATLYFLFQFSPMILIEFRSLKYYKLMRKTDSRTIRKAELQPRRIFDFVSPKIIGLAGLVYFGFIMFILYIDQFNFPWFGGHMNTIGITAMYLISAGIIAWNLYGKKQDPYRTHEDRNRKIEVVIKQVIFISIASTIFVTIQITLGSLDLRNLEGIVSSLYFQLIGIIGLWALRTDNINFEVYKEDVLAT